MSIVNIIIHLALPALLCYNPAMSNQPGTSLTLRNRRAETHHKTTITAKLVEQLVAIVRRGNYYSTAAGICRVPERTFFEWLERGNKELLERETDNNDSDNENETGGSLFARLAAGLKEAETLAEAEMLDVIRQAASPGIKQRVTKRNTKGEIAIDVKEGPGDWIAAATYLERRHPERYARRERRQVEVSEKHEIRITHVETVLNSGDGRPVIEGQSREVTEPKST